VRAAYAGILMFRRVLFMTEAAEKKLLYTLRKPFINKPVLSIGGLL